MSTRYKPLGIIFRDIQRRYEQLPGRDSQLICAEGFHMDCDVLKWRKANWTNDDLTCIRSPTGGIFFSVWISDAGARAGRVDYNLHSYYLRQLTGYRIAARDFCREFREAFAGISSAWPHVRTHFGPATLMQGWFEFQPQTLADQVLVMIDRFADVAKIIDRLLAARIYVKAPHRKTAAKRIDR